jgi:hypothetical protein
MPGKGLRRLRWQPGVNPARNREAVYGNIISVWDKLNPMEAAAIRSCRILCRWWERQSAE